MSETVTLEVDGQRVSVATGSSVVAAIACAVGQTDKQASVITRRAVSGALRGPLCGMGVCGECRVSIDGVLHRLACQTVCTDGMQVSTARGAR